MVLTNVELYEALKDRVGEEAARLIAEVVPTATELVTKRDLDNGIGAVRLEISELRAEMREGFATLKGELGGEIHKSSKETMRWMLTFFIPLWVGTWGTVLAIVLRH